MYFAKKVLFITLTNNNKQTILFEKIDIFVTCIYV